MSNRPEPWFVHLQNGVNSLLANSYYIVSQGCLINYHKVGGSEQNKSVLSQFWGRAVAHGGAVRARLSPKAPGKMIPGLLLAPGGAGSLWHSLAHTYIPPISAADLLGPSSSA